MVWAKIEKEAGSSESRSKIFFMKSGSYHPDAAKLMLKSGKLNDFVSNLSKKCLVTISEASQERKRYGLSTKNSKALKNKKACFRLKKQAF